MTHSDPDVLAMMAMGESGLPDADVRHIASCDQCRSELRSLRRVAELARSGRPDDSFATPRPEVWTRIADAVGMAPTSIGEAALAPGGRVGRRRRPARRRGVQIVAGVVALAVVTGLTVVAVLQGSRPVVVGEARLDPVSDGSGITGDAFVEERPDGGRVVVVAVDGADAAASVDSYREVWLLSSDLSRLVSLGALDGSDGRYVVPDSVDITDYPVVDVSVEPLDGDPAHSGDSIVRGTLGSRPGSLPQAG